MVLNVRRNHIRLIGDGEKGGGEEEGIEVGKREIIYLPLHCHQQNDSCIKMGKDESHFNVSLAWGTKSQDSVLKPQHF